MVSRSRNRDPVDVNKILGSVPDYIQKVQCDTNEKTKPFKCAVKSCPNAFFSSKENEKYPYKFHDFPSNEKLCRTWIQKCGWNNNNVAIVKLKVCSDHFELDDYIRNYKEEFKNPDFKRKLKCDAIPKKKLKLNNFETNIEEILDNRIEEISEPPYVLPIPLLQTDKDNKQELNDDSKELLPFEDVKAAVDHNEYLEKKVADLLVKQKALKQKLYSCERRIKVVKKDLRMGKKRDDNTICKVFSDAQINLLLGKKKVFWRNDDLAAAFILRHIGTKECYLYLKNTLNIPLPSLSCIQKWAASNHN